MRNRPGAAGQARAEEEFLWADALCIQQRSAGRIKIVYSRAMGCTFGASGQKSMIASFSCGR